MSLQKGDLLLLQELPRGKNGWSTWFQDSWMALSHQHKDQWRGTGLLFCKGEWAVLKQWHTMKGSWFRLRRQQDKTDLSFVWVHTISHPGCTVDYFASQVDDFLRRAPPVKARVVVQGDTNASLGWSEEAGSVEAVGKDAKSLILLDRFAKVGFGLVAPRSPFRHLPTSRPSSRGVTVRSLTVLHHGGFGTKGLLHIGTPASHWALTTILQGVFRVV